MGKVESMKLLLVLLSLTAGTAALVHTVDLMNRAAEVVRTYTAQD